MLSTRPEKTEDHEAIRRINCLAFDGDAEARLVDTLPEAGHVRLSLVAINDGQPVGHILFSELRIHTKRETLSALALAPIAVLPDYQRTGIGSELVRRGLERCRSSGHRIVIVVGYPEFYGRFGFSPELERPLRAPFSGSAFMAMEPRPNALREVEGTVEYPPPFGDF